MATLPRFGWNGAIQMAPHLLCVAALGTLKGAVGEAAPPQWVQGVSIAIAAALLPVCFLAGWEFRPWRKRSASIALQLLGGTFAFLAGVSAGLLGVMLYFHQWIHWTGAASFEEATLRPMAIGGFAGLLAYVLGLASRTRRGRA